MVAARQSTYTAANPTNDPEVCDRQESQARVPGACVQATHLPKDNATHFGAGSEGGAGAVKLRYDAPLHAVVQALMMVNSSKTKGVRATAAKTTVRVAGGDRGEHSPAALCSGAAAPAGPLLAL